MHEICFKIKYIRAEKCEFGAVYCLYHVQIDFVLERLTFNNNNVNAKPKCVWNCFDASESNFRHQTFTHWDMHLQCEHVYLCVYISKLNLSNPSNKLKMCKYWVCVCVGSRYVRSILWCARERQGALVLPICHSYR